MTGFFSNKPAFVVPQNLLSPSPTLSGAGQTGSYYPLSTPLLP
jgi:hypothetical protein